MALDVDQLYVKYQGQSLDYDGVAQDKGQCVQWVEYVLTDTQYGYGLQPFWGNAVDWWNNYGGSLTAFAKVTDGSIKRGDIVVFNSSVGSVYGHIDLALQDGTTGNFLGADSNWAGNLTVHKVQHNNASQVIGSLRLKGGDMPITEDQLYELIRGIAGREPTQAEASNQEYLNNPGKAIDTFWNNGGKARYENPPTNVTRDSAIKYVQANLK